MKTFEKKAHMKNGIARVFLSVLAISLEIAFVVALFTGLRQYAGWIRVVEEVMAVLLVIYLYGTGILREASLDYADSGISCVWCIPLCYDWSQWPHQQDAAAI